MVIHSDKCSDKVPGSNWEKIFLSQSEIFKDILEVIMPIPSNMEQTGAKKEIELIRKTEN